MTAKQIVEKLESLSMQVIDLDEFSPERWQAFRSEMGDVLRVLGGAKKPAVQQARGALAQAFMQLKQEDPDTYEPFTTQLDAMKATLGDATKPPPPVDESDDDELDESLFAEYLIELGEFIEQLEEAILALEHCDDPECVHSVFRMFHTIKGTAGVMQHTRLSRLAHRAEDLLDAVREGELELRSDHIDLFLEALDMIRGIHAAFDIDTQHDEIVDEKALSDLVQRIEQSMTQPPAPKEARVEPQAVEPAAPEEPADEVAAPAVDELAGEPEDEVIIDATPAVDEFAGQPEDRAINVAAHTDTTIRIDTTKLDNLIDLVGELVISANLVRQHELVTHTDDLDFRGKVTQLANIVGDLQRTSMSLRMIPIGSTLQKMRRIVRDIDSHSNKSIQLEINGQETEIDRHIVDRLYEPLVHLVRNACDHGVESVDKRLAAGKPETGQIAIAASHLGNNIIIDITDDGRGIDPDAIRAKARQRGLLKDGDVLDDKDVWRLILLPGFSTAEEITDISGRGVGMDVVNRAVRDLGGHIEVISTPGEGSTFRVSLPLTLAILEGMLVRVAGELFVIPVMNIRRIIHPSADALNHVMGKGELVKDGEKLLPLSRLYDIFHLEGAATTIDDTVLVIVTGVRRTFALMVDELVSIQDVVVKSLGPKFRELRGVSGSTILGDGSVGLILDINSLLPEDLT